MSDYFALLGEPRRPWLEPEALKKKFLTQSSEAHPDRVHGGTETEKRSAQERYAQLNRAYQALRNPKERLQHLFELETGAKPQQIQHVPAELMEFFFIVAQLFKQTDSFLAEKAKTSSPMLQVGLFETAQDWIEKLKEIQQALGLRQEALAAELRGLDERWPQERGDSRRDDLLRQLEELYRLFSYYAKWEAQVQERIVQLSL